MLGEAHRYWLPVHKLKFKLSIKFMNLIASKLNLPFNVVMLAIYFTEYDYTRLISSIYG